MQIFFWPESEQTIQQHINAYTKNFQTSMLPKALFRIIFKKAFLRFHVIYFLALEGPELVPSHAWSLLAQAAYTHHKTHDSQSIHCPQSAVTLPLHHITANGLMHTSYSQYISLWLSFPSRFLIIKKQHAVWYRGNKMIHFLLFCW